MVLNDFKQYLVDVQSIESHNIHLYNELDEIYDYSQTLITEEDIEKHEIPREFCMFIKFDIERLEEYISDYTYTDKFIIINSSNKFAKVTEYLPEEIINMLDDEMSNVIIDDSYKDIFSYKIFNNEHPKGILFYAINLDDNTYNKIKNYSKYKLFGYGMQYIRNSKKEK